MQSSSARSRRSATRRDEDDSILNVVLTFGMLASLVMLALVGQTVPVSSISTIALPASGPLPPDPSPSVLECPTGRERQDVLVA